ncbi:MAG: hypothetical protein KGM99_03800, partial [Burkholderiales bacterium]|nr:hypothetical protein [Burkholderiales bacterium]
QVDRRRGEGQTYGTGASMIVSFLRISSVLPFMLARPGGALLRDGDGITVLSHGLVKHLMDNKR